MGDLDGLTEIELLCLAGACFGLEGGIPDLFLQSILQDEQYAITHEEETLRTDFNPPQSR